MRMGRIPSLVKKQWIFWGVGAAGLLLISAGVLLKIDRNYQSGLPRDVTTRLSFTPYFYSEHPPSQFTLASKNDLTYSTNSLLVSLKNKDGKKVVISEEPMPENLKKSKVQGDEDVPGAPGSAAVSYNEGRIIGTLLTADKQTMVVINAANTLDSSIMKDLLRQLQPIK
jgi:hypothetical protein